MKGKLKLLLALFSSCCLCSCTIAVSAIQSVLTLNPMHLVRGVGEFCGDVKEVCQNNPAPREKELYDSEYVFSGTLIENKNEIYQVIDVLKFDYAEYSSTSGRRQQCSRKTGQICRLNAHNEDYKPRYTLTDLSRLISYKTILSHKYERTGKDSATLELRHSFYDDDYECYTLTFASSKAGTYTYIHTINGVLVGEGDGTFDVEDL